MTASASPADLPEVPPADRAGILDALYRFGAGQDLDDRALFESAFTERSTVDFTGPAKILGTEIPVFEGRQAIADIIVGATSRLATSHTVSNPRILRFDAERAVLWCLVEAQHLPKDDRSRHLLLKNVYTTELVREEGHWVIARMLIENLWAQGDPKVLFPGA
ncbi:nuclear transport factor 2 family protein [Alsobacter sp. KACC 23698]|uniref:Nuclear transport factor 2 family protein n=1 Tax=Alsobacter sp. KACC 23698 TaxID=3149229 RepID=A0AAU7JDG9_9HYPH